MDSILLGYYRKLLRTGFVVIPNYKLYKKFTDTYNNKYKIEMVNGTLKTCVHKNTRSHLKICPSVLFKYIDSGRIYEGKRDVEYDHIRDKIMNTNLDMKERMDALFYFRISGPIYTWKYYKRWYKITYT